MENTPDSDFFPFYLQPSFDPLLVRRPVVVLLSHRRAGELDAAGLALERAAQREEVLRQRGGVESAPGVDAVAVPLVLAVGGGVGGLGGGRGGCVDPRPLGRGRRWTLSSACSDKLGQEKIETNKLEGFFEHLAIY